MRYIVVQPSVPFYRLGLFSRLAKELGRDFTVYASFEDLGVLSESTTLPEWRTSLGSIFAIAPGLFWQRGALSFPIQRGDIVVVSGAPRCISNLALLVKARLMGAKTVWWGHYWSATSRNWSSRLRLFAMRFADSVLFYTDKEVEAHRARKHRSDRQLVFALNNGVETTAIAEFRALYDAERRPRDLLFIGRITNKCELNLLLEALTYSKCASVTLDVVGAGDDKDALQRRLAECQLGDRVVLHGGMTDEARIADIANQCKLFVYPGSVGLSLIHALAYGLPSVVHDDRKTHMPEIAAHEERINGFLFRKGNAEALADTIAGALASPKELNRMSGAALNTTIESFNAADMARRFLKVFRDMAASRR